MTLNTTIKKIVVSAVARTIHLSTQPRSVINIGVSPTVIIRDADSGIPPDFLLQYQVSKL